MFSARAVSEAARGVRSGPHEIDRALRFWESIPEGPLPGGVNRALSQERSSPKRWVAADLLKEQGDVLRSKETPERASYALSLGLYLETSDQVVS